MSYDLYFYRKIRGAPGNGNGSSRILGGLRAHTPDGGLNVEELVAFITLHSPRPPEFEKAWDGFDAHYLNPDTGTEMWFHLHREEIRDVESEYRCRGFRYTGLSVVLNIPRPLYFGFEMAKIVGQMTDHFDLYVLDPQLDDAVPARYASGHLAASWISADDRIAKRLVEDGIIDINGGCKVLAGPNFNHYMPHERSLEWWMYTFNRHDISRAVMKNNLEIYIPNLMLFVKDGEKQVHRTMVINPECSYLVPACDLFFIYRKGNTEKGFVGRARLMAEIREHLVPGEMQVGGHTLPFHIMDAETLAEKTDIFETIELESMDGYRRVSPGDFMDVKLEAN